MKETYLFGSVNPNLTCKQFDDSKLFKKKELYGILLKGIKIYFKSNETFLGFEASYTNYISGQKLNIEYKGGKLDINNIKSKELVVTDNDYINNVELDFGNFINYIKITSFKGKEIELGIRPKEPFTVLNSFEDNALQFFYGSYTVEGVKNIGFKYIERKKFLHATIFPILALRYRLNKDKEFQDYCKNNYKELLSDDDSLLYLYRACLLPNPCFSQIIKCFLDQ